MHELSVCLALLEQVGSIAAQKASHRVTRIELRVGPLSGVEAELLVIVFCVIVTVAPNRRRGRTGSSAGNAVISARVSSVATR